MGATIPIKLMNTVVAIPLLFMSILVLAIPLFDAQILFPPQLFPSFLIHFNNWFTAEFGDYLLDEKPHFFVGLGWIQLLFHWPLSVVSLYGFATRKSWFNTACLVLGFSFSTSLGAILGELLGSGRASNKLLMFYYVFAAFAVFTILRGLRPLSTIMSRATNKALGLKKKTY